MPGPIALTVTVYGPDAPRLSTPVEPVLVLVQAPSTVPSVVLAAVVVFVNEAPPGVVTVQIKDVATGGETLVLSVTAGGVIAAQIRSREHGAQRIDGVHSAVFHAPQPLL